MFSKIFKKFFLARREDVSWRVYTRIIFFLILNKLISLINKKKSIPNSCLIIFPPAEGLGDLIILSRILDIIRCSKKYQLVKFTSLAPYLQKNNDEKSAVSIFDSGEILRFENFIFPSPSLMNLIFCLVLGRSKCIGYLNSNIVNFETKSPYFINSQDPYHRRLIPFTYFFNTLQNTSPFVWGSEEREELKLRKDFLNINEFKYRSSSNKKENFIVLSTYKFHQEYLPPKKSILKELKALYKDHDNLIILGAKSKREIIYNQNLESFLRQYLKNVNFVNLTGLLKLSNALEIISQSNEFVGANNGLGNVAQMLGVNCTLILTGPENYKVRKFSKKAKFISL